MGFLWRGFPLFEPTKSISCQFSPIKLRIVNLFLVVAAPQYGSAKDVINLAGMVAANVLRGDHPVRHWGDVDWQQLEKDPDAMIVDVREVSRGGGGGGRGQEGASKTWRKLYDIKMC